LVALASGQEVLKNKSGKASAFALEKSNLTIIIQDILLTESLGG
jgi:hypothetical protein